MNLELINKIDELDFSQEETKTIILGLLAEMYELIIRLQYENQTLKDEINRLKGEKGKPDIKPSKNTTDENKNRMEKQKSKEWKKKPKNIKIDRVVIVEMDPSALPEDAIFKGYSNKIIQGITIQTDNVLYKRQVFYSESEKKTYVAPLDDSLEHSSFTPELKAQILRLYFECRMTENIIYSFLNSIGISISEGEISNIIIKEKSDLFTEEKSEILNAGISCSQSINIDDSGFRENGKNKYINIICSVLFAFFMVNSRKNGDTIKAMFEGQSIAGKVLVCDDAPQFKVLTHLIQLCWVHEERLYKKLNPIFSVHKKELKDKISEVWNFYNELKKYKENPSESRKEELNSLFDKIFNCQTGYPELNKRLELTYAKKSILLTVLDYPFVDIHNNMSENGIRASVIKRKISNGTRTDLGTTAWENHLTILTTCKKHNVSYYDYVLNIFKNQKHQMSLVDHIIEKSAAYSV